jgi:hypothetical protein
MPGASINNFASLQASNGAKAKEFSFIFECELSLHPNRDQIWFGLI